MGSDTNSTIGVMLLEMQNEHSSCQANRGEGDKCILFKLKFGNGASMTGLGGECIPMCMMYDS